MKIRRLLIALLFAAAAPSAWGQSPKARHDPKKTPPSPLSQAMTDLKSTDVSVRRRATEELARLREPRSTPALIVAMSDQDPGVRAGAARALGLLRVPDGVKELTRVLREDPEPQVRQSAAVALGFIGDGSAGGPLAAALSDGDAATRLAAVQALSTLRSPAGVPALTESLKSPSQPLRRAAALALGEIGDASAAPALRPLLKDADPAVQGAAAQALGRLGDKDKGTLSTLKQWLKKSPSPELRLAAAQALARAGDRSGRDAALETLADRSAETRFRLQAVQVLSELRDPSTRPALLKVLETEQDPNVKAAAQTLADALAAQK
jgi:HEAT repeat protein